MDLNNLSIRNKSATQLSVRSRTSSVDSGSSKVSRNSSKNRLSRLLKGTRKRSKDDEAFPHTQETERWTQQETVNERDLGLLDHGSDTLITLADDDEDSAATPVRPTLSPRPSHMGFLTTSSPLIPSQTLERPQSSSGLPSPSPSLAVSAEPGEQVRRSPSPASQLREILKPSNASTASSSSVADIIRTKSNGDRAAEKEKGFARLFSTKSRKTSGLEKASPTPITTTKFFPGIFSEEPAEKTPSPQRIAPVLITHPATPPNSHGTPSTLITPPTPVDVQFDFDTAPNGSPKNRSRPTSSSGQDSTSGSNESFGHKRNRSGLVPSKLSQAISRPLTPAPEEVQSPGGTISVPQANGGFFSSFISVAQSAATSLSNSVTSVVPGQKKPSSVAGEDTGDLGDTAEEVILSSKEANKGLHKKQEPAIGTLGAGNLSLSHLGIYGDNGAIMTSSTNPVETSNGVDHSKDEAVARTEENMATKAVSKAYASEKVITEKQASPELQRNGTSVHEEMSPIRQSIEPESGSIRRAGSVRSRLSDRRRRRTRGSSANTASGLAPPSALGKSNTWTVAPARRNKDFHNLFKSVPEDDLLIEDYAAAYQKDILLQGRIYVSEGHICFYSNIIGFVNTLVMSFDEVISVEKKSTAMIFQNGISVQTLHARYSFASLLNRDTTYELIISIWRSSHPNLRSSINGNLIDGPGTGDKTEKAASVMDDDTASEEIYDEDVEDDDDDADGNSMSSRTHDDASSTVGYGDHGAADASKAALSKRASASAGGATAVTSKQSDAADGAIAIGATAIDFPGPATHAATECGDEVSHCERSLIDETVPAPLGKVYSLTFGPLSAAFTRRLLEEQKCTDVQLDEDKRGIDGSRKEMSYQYVKPLSGPIGPKQTRCIIKCTVEQFDLEKAVSVLVTTQNPDVPSGNSFIVSTRYCLMWGSNNSTRVLMTWGIEWTGKSWIKGAIEKGAADGQLQYAKDLVALLKTSVTKSSKSGKGGKIKNGRRKKGSGSESINELPSASALRSSKSSGSSSGGLLGMLEPLINMPALVIVLSITVLILSWRVFRGGSRHDLVGVPNRVRLAAYEEMWRSEEADLWRWLEERIGSDAWMGHQPASGLQAKRGAKVFDALDTLAEQEVSEAIRTTKHKLGVLEDALKARVAAQAPKADDTSTVEL